MPDTIHPKPGLTPLALRPLGGVTILLVEDSRFAADSIRLMALRSGARLRRADCLAAARRHLQAYMPDIVIVDLGLPDGRGEDLIRDLAGSRPQLPVLAISGDDSAEGRAAQAGAAGFIPKPMSSVARFQRIILSALPQGQTSCASDPQDHSVTADPLALRDDLALAARRLHMSQDAGTGRYIGQFVGAVARQSNDADLERAARALCDHTPTAELRQDLARTLRDRINQHAPV